MRELAERAVKAKGWRWLPGMRALDSSGEEHPARVIDHRRSVVYEDNDGAIHEGVVSRSDVPDLTDPATLGCLLYLARRAWADEGVAAVVASYTFEFGYRWRVVGGHHHGSRFMAMSQQHFQTEAEALVKALEAAP